MTSNSTIQNWHREVIQHLWPHRHGSPFTRRAIRAHVRGLRLARDYNARLRRLTL